MEAVQQAAPVRPWNRPLARAFLSSPSGVAGLVVIFVILVIAIVAPPLLGDSAIRQNFSEVYASPSWAHPLGTDALGRDIFDRLLVATRLSVGLGLAATALAFTIGIALGGLTAQVGPRARTVAQRTIDALLSFPSLLVAIFVGVIIGVGGLSSVLGVGIAISFALARVTSTLALSVSGRDYVQSARVVGVPKRRLMFRYVLPNIAPPLIVALSVAVGASIVAVSALSFLGLGVQPPNTDWGRMLTEGVKDIYVAPLSALGPAVAIAMTALAFGFAGEALARAMNPRLWTQGSTRRRKRRVAGLEPTTNGAGAAGRSAVGARVNGAPARDVILDVDDLVVTFPTATGTVDVVKGVSISLARGERLGIVGESGSGKTMTALAIAQLIPHPGRATGRVVLDGEDLKGLPTSALDKVLGTDLAVVFQDPGTSLNPALRIETQVTESSRRHRGLSRRSARDLAASRLREVDIPAPETQMRRYPHQLSGGMRQRTMIAMGLMNEPSLLLADEPTTALDVTIQAQIMELLGELNRSHGMGIVLISHNLALVSHNCDWILVMYAGRVVEELRTSQLAAGPEHPYTRALLEAVPEFRIGRGKLRPIPGEAPDAGSPPPGCSFHPRCPLAFDRCRTERPPLTARPSGGKVACWAVTGGRDA